MRTMLKAGLRAAGAVLVLSAAAALVTPAEASHHARTAQPAAAVQAVQEAKVQEPETTSSIAASQDSEPGCQRSRKRLWVEGEGWIVRRVTTCY